MQREKLTLNLMLCMLLLCGSAAGAEDIPSAVGRITYGDVLSPGAAICTGVLVAPDLVLTAGHCVRGAIDDPASIRFDAGWAGEGFAGDGRGVEVILSGSEELAEDVALVVLDRPLPPEVAEPLSIAAPLAQIFTLHAFRRDAPDHPSQPLTCGQRAAAPGLLGLDCPAVSGNSGAPLLQRDEAGWHVVAVMVAASRTGAVRSWAVLPPDWILKRIPTFQE